MQYSSLTIMTTREITSRVKSIKAWKIMDPQALKVNCDDENL